MHREVANYENPTMTDARKDVAEALSIENVFYVVHRVPVDNVAHHYSNLVAANYDTELKAGLKKIVTSITAKLGRNIAKPGTVQPIFVRSLLADDQRVYESCIEGKIFVDMTSAIVGKPDSSQYVVYGFASKKDTMEDERLVLIETYASNAMEAIRRVVGEVERQMDSHFRPLFSSIKTAMTFDMIERYHASTKHFNEFMAAPCQPGAVMH